MATSSPPADGDLIEMVVEDETVSFSKTLLMESSPFFEDTFKDGQRRKNRVVISGVSGQTFKDLLEYMKSGKLELSCNNVADIFHAACKLQMPDIIRRCIDMEARTSAIGRQIILYKTAKRMNNPEETDNAFYSLVSNFMLISHSIEFLELDVKDVCELLSSDVLGCDGEMDVFRAACRWLNYDVDARMDRASKVMQCVRFPLMSLMELSHCVEAKTPAGLHDVQNVRVMMLSAICFWVAKAAGKESEVLHLARKPRHFIESDFGMPSGGGPNALGARRGNEQSALLSATLATAKAQTLAESHSSLEVCTQELEEAEAPGQFYKPEPEFERVMISSPYDSSTESSSPAESPTPTVCESSFNDTLPLDSSTLTRPTTEESNEGRRTQDCSFSQSDFCSPSDDKDRLSSLSTDSVSFTRHSDGDRLHQIEIDPLKRRLLLGNQWTAHSDVQDTKSLLLCKRPDLSAVKNLPQRPVTALATISVQTDLGLAGASCKDGEPGTLFLIGGVERNESPSDCPILTYNIKMNSWSQKKTLPVHRYGHKAVYLEGYIYIIGGFENFSPVNLEKTSSRCCFWFEVSSGRWGIMAPLNHTRAYHGLAVLDNTIYVVGGVDSNNRLLGSLERYDKVNDKWTVLSGELYSPRMAMGFCSHKQQLWVAGGIVQIGRRTCSTAYVEVYNPETERWSFAVNFLPSPRSCLTLVECGGLMYAVGGLLSHRSGKKRSFTTLEDTLVFVDERNAWLDRAPMPVARHSTVGTAHDGVIFILGGRQAEKPDFHFDTMLAYDTKLNEWASLGNVPRNVTDYHCVLAPTGKPSRSFRDLLTSRGDHRPASAMAGKFPLEAPPDIKSYSQGDVAVKRL